MQLGLVSLCLLPDDLADVRLRPLDNQYRRNRQPRSWPIFISKTTTLVKLHVLNHGNHARDVIHCFANENLNRV